MTCVSFAKDCWLFILFCWWSLREPLVTYVLLMVLKRTFSYILFVAGP